MTIPISHENQGLMNATLFLNNSSLISQMTELFIFLAALMFIDGNTLMPPPGKSDHQDLTYYLTSDGVRSHIQTPREWEMRQKQILSGIQQAMGPLPDLRKRVPLKTQILEEQRLGTLIRRKIRYRSDDLDYITGYLFLPVKLTPAVPAVLCLQQTNRDGSTETAGINGNPDLAYALHLAQRGYVTLAPDYPGFGESKYDFSSSSSFSSGSMKAIWDNLRSIDLLQSLTEVDPTRIGCIGHSLGGHNAMFTAAFDPRIQVIVSNCGFTRFHRDDVPSWSGPRYMPRIATQFENNPDLVPFDFPEIIALFAPRPFLAIAAIKDHDFDYRGVQESLDAARLVYRVFHREMHLQAFYPNTDHGFHHQARQKAYAFLDFYLKHIPP